MDTGGPNQSGSSGQPVAPATGYAGASQRKKLGIRSGSTVAFWEKPDGWSLAEPIEDAVAVLLPQDSSVIPVDTIVAFVRTPADLAAVAATLPKSIHPDGALWIAWPRKAGGHRSDITEQLLRDTLLPIGVVDTKVAAIDRDWSGLKFVWRKEMRATRPGLPPRQVTPSEEHG